MELISSKLFWIPLYLYFLYLLYRNYNWKLALWALLGVVLVVTVADRISVECFKEVFMRYRPSWNADLADRIHLVNGQKGGKYGFISSHAANHFAIATFLFFLLRRFYPRIGLWLFLWAALICYSRIYLGKHYPADIAIGAIVGILIAWLCHLVFRKLIPAFK